MKPSARRSAPRLSLVAIILVALAGSAPRAEVPRAAPESVGFSTQGLNAYGEALRALVDEGRLAGVTTLVSRHGKVVMLEAFGYQDLDARKPLATDTIFRIASMTKPITGVAMMILFEQGRWALDDPVAKYIPEFKGLQVRQADHDRAGRARPVGQAGIPVRERRAPVDHRGLLALRADAPEWRRIGRRTRREPAAGVTAGIRVRRRNRPATGRS